MAEHKLHYFNIRGKGELIRLVFAAAGEDYEDIRYKPPIAELGDAVGLDWNDEVKASTPLGQLPFFEIEGETFCQQTAIARFVARKFNLMGDNELEALKVDMVVETMWPDVAYKCIGIFFEADEHRKEALKEKLAESLPKTLKKIAQWVEGEFVLGAKMSLADLAIIDAMTVVKMFFPDLELPEELARVMTNTKENKKVKKWLETRPKSNF